MSQSRLDSSQGGAKPVIKRREAISSDVSLFSNIHPVLRTVYLNRGLSSDDQLDRTLKKLPSYQSLSGITRAVDLIKQAIINNKKIVIVADFDADGATSCTVAMRGLRLLGAQQVDFVVPDRFKFGYGLTPPSIMVSPVLRAFRMHAPMVVRWW